MLYRVVIFDLFGTLVDSFSLQEHRRALSEMAASLDELVGQEWKDWFGEDRHQMVGESDDLAVRLLIGHWAFGRYKRLQGFYRPG